MNLYVDADVLVYEAAFGAQKTRYRLDNMTEWLDDYEKLKTYCELNEIDLKQMRADERIEKKIDLLPEKTARMLMKKKIADITTAVKQRAKLKKVDVQLLLSGTNNYRDTIAVTRGYKANRATSEKPVWYEQMRGMVIGMGADVVDGIEADDAIGICQTDSPGIIATIDKDLNMLPGAHYDWNKQLTYNVKSFDAIRWFCKQLLTGDSTDNIPGIPGLGDKKAGILLEDCKTKNQLFDTVIGVYKAGPHKFKDGTMTPADNYAYLTEQMQLLWIQRKADEFVTPAYFIKEYCND